MKYSFLEKGDLAFDVGACRGTETAKMLARGAGVIAFEPHEKLATNLHHKFPSVTVVKSAVGATTDPVMFRRCTSAKTLSTCNPKWQTGRFKDHTWREPETVPCTTLDVAIEDYGTPKFIKIDVEGYGLEVLEGLSKPVEWLSFEYAREFFADIALCIQRLRKVGYHTFSISDGKQERNFCWRDAFVTSVLIEAKPDDAWGDIYARLT